MFVPCLDNAEMLAVCVCVCVCLSNFVDSLKKRCALGRMTDAFGLFPAPTAAWWSVTALRESGVRTT